MEYKKLNPEDFGLSSRTEIVEISENIVAIVKKRKSRIIMKDGEKIFQDVKSIQNKFPDIQVNLIISGAICSKTVEFLNSFGVDIMPE